MIVWLKILHISTLAIWAAGLFYMPTLFAAHPGTKDPVSFRRLRIATRLTYIGVLSPAAILAIASGTALVYLTDAFAGWLVAKLGAVSLMVAFHVYCGHILGRLWQTPDLRSPGRHYSLLAAPSILVPAVLYLVLAQPF